MVDAKSCGEEQHNLFGDLVQAPRRGRGRPAFAWTLERSNKVLLAFAAGRTKREAATAIGCSVRTLEKVFSAELEWRHAASIRFEAEQMNRLNEQAKKGNVGAEKELRKMLDSARVKQLASEVAHGANRPPKAAKLGKKEEANRAAASVRGRFQRRPGPPQPSLLNPSGNA